MQAAVLKSSYPDSTAFNAAFKELYQFIKTTPSVKERAENMLGQMGHLLQTRGIDSVAAYDSVMKNIDAQQDEKLLFIAYRAKFTAEELKPFITFFKTSAGKHYLEEESYLYSARSGEVDQYVRGEVHRILSTMGKPMETPPSMRQAPGMGQPGMPPQPPPPPIKN
jgi:uncharacterized protein DUF2059